MQEMNIYFLTLRGSHLFGLSPVTKESVALYAQLVSLFGNVVDGGITVNPAQIMTVDLKQKVNSFCDFIKPRFPVINKLEKVLRDVPEGEYFLVFPNSPITNDESLQLGNYLEAINTAKDEKEAFKLFTEKNEDIIKVFGDVLSNYDVTTVINNKQTCIGEPDKHKRVCRFCNRSMKDGVSFKNVAHAIPEALGNKSVILHEECDDCNSKFGRTVESDFTTYLEIYRVFWATPGKNGIPKIKYQNGYIENVDGKFVITHSPGDTVVDKKEMPNELKLLSFHSLSTVNIYKSLCKMALSILPNKEMAHFPKTISWINSALLGEQENNLPKVATLISHQMYAEVPALFLYIRKTSNKTLPHVVGEFKFKALIFVFIIPFSDEDDLEFVSKDEWDFFWKFFSHYNSVKGWTFQSYTSNKRGKISFNLKMEQR